MLRRDVSPDCVQESSAGHLTEQRSDVVARSRSRVWASATGTLLGAGLILSTSASSVSARPVVALQEVDAPALPIGLAAVGTTSGANASISGDGRFVVFQGEPGRTVGELDVAEESPEGADDPRASTIYLSNREDASTVELSPIPAGLRAGDSIRPVISGDGCSVVILTEMALDVFRDDDGGDRWDIYRSVLPHCEGGVGNWELVSTRDDGSALARDDVRSEYSPAVSRSGTEIAYVHPDLRLFDAPGVNTITVVDLTIPVSDPGRARVVAGMPADRPNTTFVHVGADQPAFSDDGRFVAYRSDAASAEGVPVWGTGPVDGGRATQQVFVWDRLDRDPFTAVQLVSARPDGSPATAGAGEPALSRAGRIVAFSSPDDQLVPAVFPTCAEECPTQIYRLDRDVDGNDVFDEVGSTSLDIVSVEPVVDDVSAPVVGRASSSQPSLSADGQLLVFVSKAPNLQLIQAIESGEPTDGDVLVADNGRSGLRRISVSSDGVRPAVGAHSAPQLSDSGRVAVFDTLAADQLLDEGARPGRQVVVLSSTPTLSLADADVGTTVVGLESTGWFVGLVNDGPSAFDPATVTISDSRFSIDEENSTCIVGTLVPAGGNCKVQFTFTPSSSSSVGATLTIAEEGFQAVSVSSTISGSGGEPALQIAPGGADFEQGRKVTVGTPSTEFLFDVSNVGFFSSSIADIEIEGAHAADFAVTTNACADRPLNPRASCAVGITFTPSDAGRRTAFVEVFTPQGQSTSVILAGDAEFAPELVTLETEVRAGAEFILGGTDYPPNTELVVTYGDSAGESITVLTNDDGGFLALVPVASNEHGGGRRVVVQSSSGVGAVIPIEVIEEADQYVGMPGFGLG